MSSVARGALVEPMLRAEVAATMLWMLGVSIDDMAIVGASSMWDWSVLTARGFAMHRWRWVLDGYRMTLDTEWLGGAVAAHSWPTRSIVTDDDRAP